ncbi:MAG: hypothetical protein H7836_15370 [Magnetococcus sp. YQC-3]
MAKVEQRFLSHEVVQAFCLRYEGVSDEGLVQLIAAAYAKLLNRELSIPDARADLRLSLKGPQK